MEPTFFIAPVTIVMQASIANFVNMAHYSFKQTNKRTAMKYSEAEAIVISKRENEFRTNAVIFAEQIAGDDALIAALLRFHCAVPIELVNKALDVSIEFERIEAHYAGDNLDEEIDILLIEEGGSKDESGNWL